MRAIPGVQAVSVTLGSRPMIHDSSLPFWIEGRPKPANLQDMPQAMFYLVEAGFQQAMGIALERGASLQIRTTSARRSLWILTTFSRGRISPTRIRSANASILQPST
jgi:hypothetical protein